MNRLFFSATLIVNFVCVFAWGANFPEQNDPSIAKLDSGLISGLCNGTVRVYKGIPFAAPPVGNLRWRPPQPVSPWEGVRACKEFGSCCPQPKSIMGRELGPVSEDCLYLNVWTPAGKPDEKLPVMVWIHGGGCTTGSGAQIWYDGEALARQGVVLVTINYRLGVFGFFAHPLLSQESAQNVSGNYGFLDQIAALNWVRKNIAAFGGDPDCVTIFGESAGSACVCRLLVSPLAKGLFHRAIAESGGAYGNNRHLRQAVGNLEPMEKVGEKIAAKLGCAQAPDVLAALRGKSAADLLDAADAAQGLFGKGTKFGPIVDGWALPDDPGKLFLTGKQQDVPLLAGSNADEGTIFLQQLPVKHVLGFKLFVRGLCKEYADSMLELYPAEKDDDVPEAANHMVAALAFAAPARALVDAMGQCKSKAFLYHFARVSPLAREHKLGAFHAAEIAYVFDNIEGNRQLGYDAKDRELARAMSGCWVRFAKAGDPNGAGFPQWPAYTRQGGQCLEFGDEIKVKTDLYKEAYAIFEKRREEALGNAP